MHHTRHRRRAAVAASALALALLAAPAARAEDTATTFTLTAGGLTVSVPATAELSSSTLLGTSSISSQLGTVQVTDNRGLVLGGWTATVSSSDFVRAGVATNNVIAKANVSYDTGVVAPVGGGIAVPVGTVSPVVLSESRDVVVTTGVTGTATVAWNPTVSVTIPTDVVAGAYEGTITHSAA